MEAAASWSLVGTAANLVVSLLLTGALITRPSRWLVERTAASYGLAAISGAIALILNRTRFALPIDRAALEWLVLGVVVLCVLPPLWWLGTVAYTWVRERDG